MVSNQEQNPPTSYAPSLQGILLQPITAGTTPPSTPSLPQFDPTCPLLKPTEPQGYFGSNPSGLTDHELSHPMAWLQELASNQPAPRDTTTSPVHQSPSTLLEESAPTSSTLGVTQPSPKDAFKLVGQSLLDQKANSTGPIPNPKQSMRFTLPGIGNRIPNLGIGGINGMNTKLDYALGHATYLQQFASGVDLDWVYNCSHGPIADAVEIFANYMGYSPNTANLLRNTWTEFHFANNTNSNIKYLQYCHSQGAIHVRNALAGLPKEIRDRVIVVAIAPGAIIPDDMCYRSFNYACKGDPVPLGEFIPAGAFDTNEIGMSPKMREVMTNQEQLIVLQSHPASTGIGHDFRDPTFAAVIKQHMEDYLAHNGEYQ
jgi:hypothetical protein